MDKYCPACASCLPTTEFNKDKYKPDGLNAYCKYCRNKRNIKYYATDAGKYNRNKNVKTWHKNNPRKRKAQLAVMCALRAGTLTRPKSCSICDAVCKPDGHHPDYSKPLEVQWVCKSCHYKIHKA